ncbi:MAG: fused response regulator/phosphatase [Fuerstiella sp.]|nr:fused response regulator/phosphatase [Fuerstiella sp.]MCP4784932.1 fused response regulator/phosphatase [Fuerstiella sp.]MCP4858525.1 fused response regulator/phosphatase [Fuerstiella sp.]
MTSKSPFELLLVEDNPADAGLIQANLRMGLGKVSISRVERLSEAVAAISSKAFSVVLLDLNLPDSTGLETFRRFAECSNGTPIVVLSGMEDAEMAIKAMGAGAEDYVQKGQFDAQTLARSVRFAIERNTRLSAERELINVRSELATAQHLQDSLYPQSSPDIEGFDIGAGVRSAGIGCGDYYDFIELRDGRYVIVVGDVSGHGMRSAIVMAETRACLRTLADVDTTPRVMLPAMNRLICAGTSAEMFVSLLLVILEPLTKSFEYFNAGHPGWILRESGREQLNTHQIPLGLINDVDHSVSEHFTLNSGDLLVLPTDGVFESFSAEGMFGSDRMLQVAESCRELSASGIVDRLFDHAISFANTEMPEDDMTTVILKAL